MGGKVINGQEMGPKRKLKTKNDGTKKRREKADLNTKGTARRQ